MRGSLIRHVDPWQDAARGARYEGHVGADRLPRLGALAKVEEPLWVGMSFAFTSAAKGGASAGFRGGVQVDLKVEGTIEVDCQRCLEPMTVELAVHNTVLIVRDEAAARASESSAEAVVSEPGDHLELATLVEDETLLGMPFAPCHPQGECELDSQALEAMARATVQEDAVQDELQGFGRELDQESGRVNEGGLLDIREPGESGLPGAAQRNNAATGVEARPNPFAVLARLRDGGESED